VFEELQRKHSGNWCDLLKGRKVHHRCWQLRSPNRPELMQGPLEIAGARTLVCCNVR